MQWLDQLVGRLEIFEPKRHEIYHYYKSHVVEDRDISLLINPQVVKREISRYYKSQVVEDIDQQPNNFLCGFISIKMAKIVDGSSNLT
jgi:hypothetical protein